MLEGMVIGCAAYLLVKAVIAYFDRRQLRYWQKQRQLVRSRNPELWPEQPEE
jgi:hypothetical protein